VRVDEALSLALSSLASRIDVVLGLADGAHPALARDVHTSLAVENLQGAGHTASLVLDVGPDRDVPSTSEVRSVGVL
jgi:hypothetical protein